MQNLTRNTFKKNEILSREKDIKTLFEEGSNLFIYPFKIIYRQLPIEGTPDQINERVQLLISIPKRNFRRAVKRNVLRRRIREIYRKTKHPFYRDIEEFNMFLHLAIIYTATDELPFAEMKKKLELALIKLMERLRYDKKIY